MPEPDAKTVLTPETLRAHADQLQELRDKKVMRAHADAWQARVEALEKWGTEAEQVLVYAATVVHGDGPLAILVGAAEKLMLEWADLTTGEVKP